ncbi:MAG: DUF11 domain-containing protein [Clostridia bacterium]|nr:DUF11 domain-containing protein [Clostridia bacterium]
MKSKFLRAVALILILNFSFLWLVSCEESHEHVFSQTYSFDENSHWTECACGEKYQTENHTGGNATCKRQAKCDVCGERYGELAEHSFVILKETTAQTHLYRCTCGEEKGAEAHNFSVVIRFNTSKHWLKCACGYEEGAKDHTLVAGVCDCGYRTPEADHVHDFNILRCDGDEHWYECACKESTTPESHKGGAATCEKQAECEVCTMSYGEVAAHSYTVLKISESEHWYECLCGDKAEAVSHDFVGGACVCGYEAPDQSHVHAFTVEKFNKKQHWNECECGVFATEEAHKGGNATCEQSAVCEVCEQSYGEPHHDWNDGELSLAPTVDSTGFITYTCLDCNDKKNVIVEAGATVITRADIEEAIVDVAWAYYMKGDKLQYDSIALSAISNHYGGTCRHTREVSPEYGTSDTTIFSVCTGYPTKVYMEAIERYIWENKYSPNGVVTLWFWVASDNQSEESFRDYYENESDPITENDRDTAILRWADYEKYIVDEAEELPYAESLGTFDSTSFTDWYKKGTLEYYNAEGEDAYSYYLNGRKIDVSEAKGLVLEYLTEKNKDGEYVNLRPGDILTEDTHTLLYIGNGYVLDCNGYKYDLVGGVDKVEANGSIYGRMKTIEAVLNSAVTDFVVTRPLDYYTYDLDSNPANDIIKYEGEDIEITEATYSRMETPAMEIDRTVNITPYGTANQGEELVYKVKISNRTDEANYTKWRNATQKGYAGEDYNGVVITEIIPEGTTFVSASEGYTIENGVLTWTVDVFRGQSVEVFYTVKVNAEIGSVITSEGGSVNNIPSNSISNRVGGEALSEEAKNILLEIAASGASGWSDTYGTDLAFAEAIYAAMGMELDLPTLEAIIENMFTPTYIEKVLSMTVYYKDIDSPMVMYMPQENVGEEYELVQKMLVDGYLGGYRLYNVDLEKFKEQGIEGFDFPAELDKNILEFDFGYLEVGDILVYATAKNRGDTDMTSEVGSSRILIYVGNETFIEMSSSAEGAVYSGEDANEILATSFKNTNDLFFLLRPSQVMESAE